MIIGVKVVEGIVGILFVDDRRLGLQRLLHVQNMGQFFVIHLDGINRFLGCANRGGNDCKDRLANIADLVGCQKRFVVPSEIDQRQERVGVHGNVAAAQHTNNPVLPLRSRGIDRPDARVVVGRTHATHVQEPVESMVVIEFRTPGYVTQDVLPDDRLANDIEVVRALVGKKVLAILCIHHAAPRCLAASSMASMIGS